MSEITRRTFGARVLGIPAAVAVSLSLLPSAAQAQKLSDRPITIIVPFSPGSGPDLLARLAADHIRNRWGQAVVVDNRLGASGNIGAAAASRAAPDGHTLLLFINTVLMNAALSRNLGFDPVSNFQPIIEIARGSLALAVHNSVAATDTQSLIAASIAKPEDIRFGSPGRGTPHHLAMELFKLRTGAKLTHVPYSGTGGVVNDFIGGHIQSMFIPVHIGLTHAQAGKIRLLALGSNERSPLAPQVPTLAEQGIRDAEVDLWYGLSAPAGTPDEIVQRFNTVISDMLKDAAVRASLQAQGLEASGGTSKAFAALIEKDLARWKSIVQSANISAEN